jgi:hypothetical protein
MLWEKDEREYILRHLVDKRPPRTPQELPASVGSSFDAWVKADLHAKLFGAGTDPQFEFSAIFESQVEAHNRDRACEMGLRCFDSYVHTGAYDELVALMENAKEDPQFEFTATGEVFGVPMTGKPDCRFVTQHDLHIILDWKVKGYCSKWGASPAKGYRIVRDGIGWLKPSRGTGKAHKLYKPMLLEGLEISQTPMEQCDKDWATQLSIYGWLLGEPVGAENVVICIDEIPCKSRQDKGQPPLLRVANHRAQVSPAFQKCLAGRIKVLWDRIENRHLFPDMSRADSQDKFETIQRGAIALASDGSYEEDLFNELSRPGYRK